MNPHTNGRPGRSSPEEVPEGVEEIGVFLRRWRDPAPDPAAKAELMTALLAEMENTRAHSRAPLQEQVTRRDVRARIAWAWLILRSQVRLVHPATWAASALVIALGALVTLILYQPTQGGSELAFDMPAISRDMIVVIQGLVILFAGALEHMFRPALERLFRPSAAAR